MKKIILSMLISLLTSTTVLAATPYEPLNPEIFQLVQTTPRAHYYFNKKVITFQKDQQGNIDPNILIVPTVKVLDPTEVEDVTIKRMWKNESTYRFNELAAEAEYLAINLTTGEIKFMENQYLDRGYNPITPYTSAPINLNDLGEKNVNYNFYKTIIDFGKEHQREILKSLLAEGYKLTPDQLNAFQLLPNGDDLPMKKSKQSSKRMKGKK